MNVLGCLCRLCCMSAADRNGLWADGREILPIFHCHWISAFVPPTDAIQYKSWLKQWDESVLLLLITNLIKKYNCEMHITINFLFRDCFHSSLSKHRSNTFSCRNAGGVTSPWSSNRTKIRGSSKYILAFIHYHSESLVASCIISPQNLIPIHNCGLLLKIKIQPFFSPPCHFKVAEPWVYTKPYQFDLTEDFSSSLPKYRHLCTCVYTHTHTLTLLPCKRFSHSETQWHSLLAHFGDVSNSVTVIEIVPRACFPTGKVFLKQETGDIAEAAERITSCGKDLNAC